MERKIIRIDEQKCNGCGLCVPNCPEGAIQIINGKARLTGELFCDGLGACLGHCPEGAIAIEEREAMPYDERKVMAHILEKGEEVVASHLTHLKDHGQHEYLRQAMEFLKGQPRPEPLPIIPLSTLNRHDHGSGCPGIKSIEFDVSASETSRPVNNSLPSELTHWPIQLHLVSPLAPHYHERDVLLAADCVAYAMGDFHRNYLQGRALSIACPKLDQGQEQYLEKITALIDLAEIRTLTVLIMQVPCCHGLLRLAQAANSKSSRKIPIKSVVVSLRGQVLEDRWM